MLLRPIAKSPFWTTIANFYDANDTLIRHFVEGRDAEELEEAAKVRLPDTRIEFYQSGVVEFYKKL